MTDRELKLFVDKHQMVAIDIVDDIDLADLSIEVKEPFMTAEKQVINLMHAFKKLNCGKVFANELLLKWHRDVVQIKRVQNKENPT